MKINVEDTEYKVSYKHLNFTWRGKNNEFCLFDDDVLMEIHDIKYYDCIKELSSCALILGQIKQYICMQNPSIFSADIYNNIQAVTICELAIDKVVKGIGFAFCGPEDQFCKKTGREMSLERASWDLQRARHKKSIIYGGVK